MLPTIATLLFAALATPTFAQTSSTCADNLVSCPVESVQQSQEVTFNSAKLPDGWVQSQCQGKVAYNPDGTTFTIAGSGDCPGIETQGSILFGLVEVKAKVAPGTGIVSSMILLSQDLDEVDWEFIGGDNANVQTNYYGKGNHTTYDRVQYVPVADPQNQWHTYTVNWTSAAITYLIDGKIVRTLNYADALGGKNFPQSPMKIKLGIWAGGDPTKNEAGTVTWALGNGGGKLDYSKGPFSMSVASVKIVNYSPGKTYKYTDNSGSWQSIKIEGGQAGGIVSAGQVAAQQGSQPTSSVKVSTGSGNPNLPPIETVSGNASATVIPKANANATGSVSTPSLTPSASASTGSKASATKSGAALATTNAAPVHAAFTGAATGSVLLAIFMALLS